MPKTAEIQTAMNSFKNNGICLLIFTCLRNCCYSVGGHRLSWTSLYVLSVWN